MTIRPLTALVAFLAATTGSLGAFAGSCPEDHVLTEPRDLERVGSENVQVKVMDTVDLGGWRGTDALTMRTRHFTIQPGGKVARHSHGDRPSMLYFISGEATEHNSLCNAPIVHKAGDSAAEFGADVLHWWANDGDVPAVLISVDLIPTR